VRLAVASLAVCLLTMSLFVLVPGSEAGSWTCGGTPYATNPGTEVVRNGGFENDFASWYTRAAPPSISIAVRHSGTKSARVLSAGSAENSVQDLSPTPSIYVLSYWFYVAAWGTGGHFAVETLTNWDPSFGTADIPTQLWWLPPNTMTWRVWTRNGGTDTVRTYPMTLATGTWHLLETVVDGDLGIQCLFIDGTYVDSLSVSPASTFTPTVLAFGDISTAGDAGDAYYDDLSIQDAGPPIPDYVPTSPQPPGSIEIGEFLSLPLSIRVMNQGTGSANATSTMSLFNESTPYSPFATFSLPPMGVGEIAGPFTATWTSPGVPGTYRIVAEVDTSGAVAERDEGNNRYSWTATVYPPPITTLALGSPNYLGTNVTSATPLTLSVVDRSGHGILRTEFRIDSGPWVPYSGAFTLSGEADHLVEWFSEDNVGNVEAVQGLSLRLDDTPPTSTSVIAGPSYGGQFIASASRVSLSTVDGGSLPVGVDVLQYSLDGQAWTQYVAPLGFTGPDGPRNLSFRARDLLGNTEATQSLHLILDNTAPASTSSIAGPNYGGPFITSASRISLSGADGGLPPVGLSVLEYSFDGQLWSPYSGPLGLTGADGARTLYFRATDLLGNAEAPRTLSVILDDSPPTSMSTIAGSIYGQFITSSSRISLSTVDGGSPAVGVSGLEVSLDGQNWNPYAGPFGLTGADGARTLYFRATDLLGNAEAPRTLSLILDNAPPTTELLTSPGMISVASRFSLSAGDAGSGVASTEYRVDGGRWIPYTGAFSLAVGDHVIEYRSVDRLGNSEPVRTASIRIENWKPLLALAFSIVLIIVGAALALRRSASGDSRSRRNAFLIGTVPFVLAEAATGIASWMTGVLAIPPDLDMGTFVDVGIFVAGIVAAILVQWWIRKPGVRPPPA